MSRQGLPTNLPDRRNGGFSAASVSDAAFFCSLDVNTPAIREINPGIARRERGFALDSS
jgi:hypothetical protein